MIDLSRVRLPPFRHQAEDTETLVDNPYLLIASEMRTGKTKIVIDGAQVMNVNSVINRVIVVAPAPVRSVWFDPDLGELRKHLWKDLYSVITEFHSRLRVWNHGTEKKGNPLEWFITNYEFLRSKRRLEELLDYCTEKTLLVLDESSFVKNWKAEQTKACFELRKYCGRIVELNGTPISHSPKDLFSQGNLLHPSILECKYITHYMARYALMAPVLGHGGKVLTDPYGRAIKTVTGWTNLEDLQRRFAPYTIRRLQKDCLDLPPKLDPVTLSVPLDAATWRIYKDMRDELVVWLKSGDVVTAAQAAVKSLRLSQITSGFLGGAEDANIGEQEPDFFESLDLENMPTGSEQALNSEHRQEDLQIRIECPGSIPGSAPLPRSEVAEIGREKLDLLLWFLGEQLDVDLNLHIVVWCRFRPELFRMLAAVSAKFPQFEMGSIVGGQKPRDRIRAMALLKPETSPKGPVFVGGTYGTGSFGLDFTAAHTSFNCSYDYSLGKFLQAGDRVYGPGQTQPVAYFDLVATGPAGQKTIDHHIIKTRRANQDIAEWTTSAWITALLEE